ncbi:hypothetical protein K491DRAFT_512506 [Lophiostoma macrostomum CBS 122681]|uniref:Uncharacterized protein n=1 Tax=Lophiostoma macrostomum CBS 122681 TaxID=1314788 RepID=A0A6A6T0Y8_9PLEO|nr:hypothetical protein K491DRAFT_512506 [Lophiostoma macrostomum CBS 122681]
MYSTCPPLPSPFPPHHTQTQTPTDLCKAPQSHPNATAHSSTKPLATPPFSTTSHKNTQQPTSKMFRTSALAHPPTRHTAAWPGHADWYSNAAAVEYTIAGTAPDAPKLLHIPPRPTGADPRHRRLPGRSSTASYVDAAEAYFHGTSCASGYPPKIVHGTHPAPHGFPQRKPRASQNSKTLALHSADFSKAAAWHDVL